MKMSLQRKWVCQDNNVIYVVPYMLENVQIFSQDLNMSIWASDVKIIFTDGTS